MEQAPISAGPLEASVRHSSEAHGPSLSVKIKRELFSFRNEQEWVNKAQSWYANCGVRKGHYITVDALGHVMHMGKCFMEATRLGAYPVTVYELKTNWADGA